jgi:hypothetical protein
VEVVVLSFLEEVVVEVLLACLEVVVVEGPPAIQGEEEVEELQEVQVAAEGLHLEAEVVVEQYV